MRAPRSFRAVTALAKAIVATVALTGNPAAAEEPAPYSQRSEYDYKALTQELLEWRADVHIQINAQSAVSYFAPMTFPINEHFVELISIEAETIKKSGERLSVGPDKILVSTQPNASELGVFQADVKNRTIVFPNVEAGDTVHYIMTQRMLRTPFAGGFDAFLTDEPSSRTSEGTVRLDVPAGMKVHTKTEGFTEQSTSADGRIQYVWTLQPQTYRRPEAGAISSVDTSPFVLFTSHKDDLSIAKSFYDAAAPKAEPTPEVRALAEEITRGMTDRRSQARAIHDYVSVKIRYFLIMLGQGGFVPRFANEILTSKLGDCKDHVTLMRALLAAKGIESEYVLIAIGSATYRDFEVPINRYDHVILYVPEFAAYTDPTSDDTAFGSLPYSGYGKLVLRIDKAGTVVRTRVPAASPDIRKVVVKVDVTLRSDGTPKGTATWSGQGIYASTLRERMALAAISGRTQLANDLLKKANWIGSGDIESRDAYDHSEPYAVKTSFDLRNAYFGKGVKVSPLPVGPRLLNITPYGTMLDYVRDGRKQPVICLPAHWEFAIHVQLPVGKTLAKLPDAVDVKSETARYQATYKMDGNKLQVWRLWTAMPTSTVCGEADMRANEQVARAAVRDGAVRIRFAGEVNASPASPTAVQTE